MSLIPSALACEELADQCFAEGARAFRRDEAFRIQGRRTLRRGRSPCAQLPNTLHERVHVAQLGIRAHGAEHFVLALHATRPRDGDLHLCAVALDVDDHAVHQTAHHRLSITGRCPRDFPQGHDIGGDRSELVPLLSASLRGGLPQEALIRLLELPRVSQGFLPALLQGRGHQAVGRIDALIPPFGQVHLIACALHLVLPVLV